MIVYKQNLNDKYMKYLITLDDSDLYTLKGGTIEYNGFVPTITDYAICSNDAYKYEVFVEAIPKNSSYDESNITRYLFIMNDYIHPIWKTWSICDLDFFTSND